MARSAKGSVAWPVWNARSEAERMREDGEKKDAEQEDCKKQEKKDGGRSDGEACVNERGAGGVE